MTDKKFDPTRPVQTRDSRRARIICTDMKGQGPIVALVTNENGGEIAYLFTAHGRFISGGYYHGPDGLDLINIPARIHQEAWANVYFHGAVLHSTRKEADEVTEAPAAMRRLACIPIIIDCEEGEGL